MTLVQKIFILFISEKSEISEINNFIIKLSTFASNKQINLNHIRDGLHASVSLSMIKRCYTCKRNCNVSSRSPASELLVVTEGQMTASKFSRQFPVYKVLNMNKIPSIYLFKFMSMN